MTPVSLTNAHGTTDSRGIEFRLSRVAEQQLPLKFMAVAPRVSIVIPTYNNERFLASAVRSVIAQTFEDWELVLFDDGSQDQTPELARRLATEDSRIRAVAGVHGGAAHGRNQGFAETSPESEYISFLDNDDTWEPFALDILRRALDENPSAPAAHGLARAIDPDGRQFPADDLTRSMLARREIRDKGINSVPPTAPTSFEALLVENYPVTPGTMLVRRNVWKSLGGYVSDTVPCEDWDLNLRLARRGAIVLVNEIVLNWRRHPNAISNTSRRWRTAYLAVRKRAIFSEENTDDQRRAAITALGLSCRGALSEFRNELVSGHMAESARALARWCSYQMVYWRALRAAT